MSASITWALITVSRKSWAQLLIAAGIFAKYNVAADIVSASLSVDHVFGEGCSAGETFQRAGSGA